MIKSRMETYNSKKKKQMKKWLIGGLVTTSLIGMSELTSNTYAYFTDQAQVNPTISTAFVFPSTLQSLIEQLQACEAELNDMIQTKQFNEKRIGEIEQTKSAIYDQLQSYYDRAQKENQNMINLQSVIQNYLESQRNQGSLITQNSNTPLTDEKRDSSQQELNQYMTSEYGLLNGLLTSNQDKADDLYEAMRSGEISSYDYVLYLERNKPDGIDYTNYFISINEQLVNEVEGTSKVFQYVSESLSSFNYVSNSIDHIIQEIRVIQEELRREAEEKARKEKEEKERKEKEELEKKKLEEEKAREDKAKNEKAKEDNKDKQEKQDNKDKQEKQDNKDKQEKQDNKDKSDKQDNQDKKDKQDNQDKKDNLNQSNNNNSDQQTNNKNNETNQQNEKNGEKQTGNPSGDSNEQQPEKPKTP